MLRFFLPAALACSLVSCANKKMKDEEPNPFGPTGIPPELRSRNHQESGATVAAGGNARALPQKVEITPEEDIVFTDPDNPDASLPELSSIIAAAPKKRGPWEESETIAKKRAAREGKPLLIWFTDSKSSPMCRALNQELFSTPEFNSWAEEKIVRLRVDSDIDSASKPPDMSLGDMENRRVELRNYVNTLKKRYRVLGHPSVIMLHPDGSVISPYRGYKRGEAQLFFGKLKHAESVAARRHGEWRKKMENRGYRDWSDRQGQKFFARLAAYSKGSVVLVEPDGTRARTDESKLSDADRKWIEEQKRLRGTGG